MAFLKGQNLRIKYGKTTAAIVASATTCSVNLSATLEDASTKDDVAMWSSQECTGKSWDISSEALVKIPGSGSVTGISALDLIGETVKVEFGLASGDDNQTITTWYSGDAIVNSVQVNAQNKQNVTYSVQMTGVGPLTKA